jgi:membrane protein YqaA with SNARE-associated domain
MGFLRAVFGLLLTPYGLPVLAALDSSVAFFLPLAVDMAIVYLAAGDPDLFWIFPLLATVGSCAGATVTYRVGRAFGDEGIERIVSRRRFERIREIAHERGAVALALAALLPPPFPYTAFILASGVLEVSFARFLAVLAGVRLLRFSAEAGLAARHGESVIAVMHSDGFRIVIAGVAVLAVAGTSWSAWRLWRLSRKANPSGPG